ncbi:MAG TPA: mechanosensitive ion channel family protein [Gammaproteobacteria bacterium]|nr:mechanosensitive ion channel family protein [Gammaproteobacteria bacterium]
MKDLFTIFEPALAYLQNYPLVFSLLILVAALLLANLLALLVTRVVGYLASRTRIRWDDQVVRIIHRPLFWTVLCVGVLLAMLPLEIPALAKGVVHSLIITLLIIIWANFFMRLVRIMLRAMSDGTGSLVRPQTRPLFENLAFLLILAVAVYMVFRSWNVDMTAWLASAGIVGIAVGFAAKDTLANLFSGVFILADAPYKIGDYVVLDSGERGKVTRIGIRSTRLQTRDDVEITIPNAIMGNSRIVNESGGPHEKYRIRVSVGAAYGSDIDQVKKVLMEIAVSEPQVCEEPEPRVRFRAFGASSLDVNLLCWVENPEMRGRVLDILNTAVYKRFNAEGIEIPYSKQDVYIKEMPGIADKH